MGAAADVVQVGAGDVVPEVSVDGGRDVVGAFGPALCVCAMVVEGGYTGGLLES